MDGSMQVAFRVATSVGTLCLKGTKIHAETKRKPFR